MSFDLQIIPSSKLCPVPPPPLNILRSMAEDLEVLALLLHELPDPEQDLFLQHSNGPQEFTFFPKLPLEIRLSVWRSAFPAPRHVNLSPFLVKPSGRLFSQDSRRQTGLPITLRINHESRADTKRFFHFVPRHGKLKIHPRDGSLHFRPDVDSVYMMYCSMMHYDFQIRADKWISEFLSQDPNPSAIEHLKIRDMPLVWDATLKDFRKKRG